MKSAKRTIVARDPDGCPDGTVIDLVDEPGRTAHIEGTNVNRFPSTCIRASSSGSARPQWTMDGVALVGEDEDNWGIHDFRRYIRTAIDRKEGPT